MSKESDWITYETVCHPLRTGIILDRLEYIGYPRGIDLSELKLGTRLVQALAILGREYGPKISKWLLININLSLKR